MIRYLPSLETMEIQEKDMPFSTEVGILKTTLLVGGWTNPVEKY